MDNLWDTLTEFVVDYCEYLPNCITEVDTLPTPNEFLSNYVITNQPFVVRTEGYQRFRAVNRWEDQFYMRNLMKEKKVTVAVTPNGRADSIVDDLFMVPEERVMLFDDYCDEFLSSDPHQVYYLQKQNNNLIEEFSPLVKDVASHVSWASEAFDCLPDAANIWMGDHKSVTSVHKDHYENIYCVITGHKKFILYPPVALSWMPYKKYKKFQWKFIDNINSLPKRWEMIDLNEEVEWIEPSHKPQTPEQLKLFSHTKEYLVTLGPGDFLYIPALWFHEVHQTEGTIAVNYWYDMKYDVKYPYFTLLGKLSKLTRNRRDAAVDTQTELEEKLYSDLYEKNKEFLDKELIKKFTYHKHDTFKKF